MENQTYKYLYNDVIKALKTNQLLSALQSLQGMAATIKAWNIKEEADGIIDAYQMLLTYFVKGTNDPSRNKMLHQFHCRAYELAEMLLREGDLKDETSYYTTSLKTLSNIHGNSFVLSDLLTPQASARDMFDAIWTSGAWTIDDTNAIYNYLTDDEIREEYKCLALSATTLSAMKYFDIAKVKILLDQAISDDVKLRVRALTGLIFVIERFSERLILYPQVYSQLQLTSDQQTFRAELNKLQLQLFVSLETKRLERNLQENIIPKLMKQMDTLRIDSSIGLDELNEKLTENDLNPAWNEQTISPELEKFVREYAALQQSGADVYMGSFKMLKNRFPFFSIASNWFWPFTFDNPDIPKELKDNKLLQTLFTNAVLCDSDKYSFCLIFNQQGIASKLAGNQQMEELLSNHKLDNVIPKEEEELFKEEMQSYVQGFYRFCHLFSHREEIVNPFQLNLFLFDYQAFAFLREDSIAILNMADKLFKTKVYDIAQKLYAFAAKSIQDDKLYQKLGYCYEHFNEIEKAYDCYTKANILAPNTTWTLQRLAVCSRSLEHYDEALTCYDQLAIEKSEDANIALHQAECLIHLKRYEEAFKYLFKANYLAPDSRSSERALAWCSLLTNKYEQAEKYYLKVLSEKPTPTDYLNAGHSAWLLGNYNEAVSRYRKSLQKEKSADFLQQDATLLKQAGLTDDDIMLMTDAVTLGV